MTSMCAFLPLPEPSPEDEIRDSLATIRHCLRLFDDALDEVSIELLDIRAEIRSLRAEALQPELF